MDPLPDLSEIIRVECNENSDPKSVTVVLPGGFNPTVDYTFYQMIQKPLGLPDIVC